MAQHFRETFNNQKRNWMQWHKGCVISYEIFTVSNKVVSPLVNFYNTRPTEPYLILNDADFLEPKFDPPDYSHPELDNPDFWNPEFDNQKFSIHIRIFQYLKLAIWIFQYLSLTLRIFQYPRSEFDNPDFFISRIW